MYDVLVIGAGHAGCEAAAAAARRGARVAGIETSSGTVSCRAVVIATGTFLAARMYVGEHVVEGGRRGENASRKLARQIEDIGLGQGRLKTGTPPRLDGRTIDWARLGGQPSDSEPWIMSALDDCARLPQLSCAITRTNERTHDVIRANFDRSPLFAGAIEGRGPRYCPSIEDKVKRFEERDAHQIFLEPEGLDDATVYPNGISTSLPADVQEEFVRTISGLERVEIARPGYAVEYEFVDPRRLNQTLQARELPGLFLAGQINGTTGYEEAAAQGLAAGLNAAASALQIEEIRFDRRTSYIGVMIDDLTLQGVSEPYRMMTARAEYRLLLRADNATTRLGEAALEAGCVSEERRRQIETRLALRSMSAWAETEEGRADALYAPYVARQQREWEVVQRDSRVWIPAALDFGAIPGLSNEMVERLRLARPETLDHASRVPGVTPAALSALYVAASRRAAA